MTKSILIRSALVIVTILSCVLWLKKDNLIAKKAPPLRDLPLEEFLDVKGLNFGKTTESKEFVSKIVGTNSQPMLTQAI